MKRSIIILLVLIVLFAMPVLAKPMVAVTSPFVDDGFMLDELNDEQMQIISGNIIKSQTDGASPLTKDELIRLGWLKEYTLGFGIGFGANCIATNNCDGTYTITVNTGIATISVTGTIGAIQGLLNSMVGQNGLTTTMVNQAMNALNSL